MSARRKRTRAIEETSGVRDRTHSSSEDRSSSRNTELSVDRLTAAITSLIETTTQREKNSTPALRGDMVPVFDPDDRTQTVVDWCRKIDELRDIFNWSEEATIYFAMSKLQGLAEVWYKSLPSLKFTWEEWKQKLETGFPSKREFYTDLQEMLKRFKRQDETYTKYYYEKLAHVDALSRNPIANSNDHECEVVLHIEEADWVLAGQLTDDKIKEIHKVLLRPPTTDYEKSIYKNYCLRDGRIYRITARGILWVVPRGMRQRVVKAAHDDLGHFGVERTLYKLCESYWFPRMRKYVEQYISCCIPCLYNKRNRGKKEGFLHPIPKGTVPLNNFHVDHLGPFPKSKRNNQYLIVGIDAFTKYAFLRAAKSTKTKYVIEYFRDIFATYGTPKNIISDQGSSFTSKVFQTFCRQNNIRHIINAVATPRANGQVERLNSTILGSLLPSIGDEELWDDQVRSVQFAINNVINKSTGKTPAQLMFGFVPRGNAADTLLRDEVNTSAMLITDIISAREEAATKVESAQAKQKIYYDRKRKKARIYKEGDLVVVLKQIPSSGVSRKLNAPYSGPMIVKTVLPNDRYIVRDMANSHRTNRPSRYERTIAVDRMRPWCPPGGISDSTDSESGEDGVVLSSDVED